MADNPPAFPAYLPGSLDEHPGMGLRDWFAGQAIAGIEATRFSYNAQDVAEAAYALADAMLAHRVQP